MPTKSLIMIMSFCLSSLTPWIQKLLLQYIIGPFIKNEIFHSKNEELLIGILSMVLLLMICDSQEDGKLLV